MLDTNCITYPVHHLFQWILWITSMKSTVKFPKATPAGSTQLIFMTWPPPLPNEFVHHRSTFIIMYQRLTRQQQKILSEPSKSFDLHVGFNIKDVLMCGNLWHAQKKASWISSKIEAQFVFRFENGVGGYKPSPKCLINQPFEIWGKWNLKNHQPVIPTWNQTGPIPCPKMEKNQPHDEPTGPAQPALLHQGAEAGLQRQTQISGLHTSTSEKTQAIQWIAALPCLQTNHST